eukprot:m.436535 g.436535  ORF g.436535 m.436535 type:complete len:74 (-) comp17988_c0_seq1:822-1043(-)
MPLTSSRKHSTPPHSCGVFPVGAQAMLNRVAWILTKTLSHKVTEVYVHRHNFRIHSIKEVAVFPTSFPVKLNA